jgi:3',5'-cyclic AMP phosphodiesterase CpdA
MFRRRNLVVLLANRLLRRLVGFALAGACLAATPVTLRSAETVIRIALVADTHVTRGTVGDQPFYRGRFERVIAAVNAAKVDVVLVAGDLTAKGTVDELRDFKTIVRGFTAPVHCVPGNHDLGQKVIPGKPDAPSARRIADYERELGPTFFVRTTAGLRVIGINSAVLGSGLPVEQEMWKLLEAELARPGALPTVVLQHHPLFVNTADEPGGVYWNVEPAPRRRLIDLLRSGDVRTVLTGHVHRPIVNRHAGILFVSTLPVSFGLPRGKQPQGWTLVTLRPSAEAEFEFRTVSD